MDWLSGNAFFLIILLVCMVMHLFHGLGGHGGHGEDKKQDGKHDHREH